MPMSPSTNGITSHGTLMIIDDDEISLSLISLLLTSSGYKVMQAPSGVAGVDLLARMDPADRPAILLADLRMPGLSGHGLACELRRLVPRAKLLAMSATPGSAEGYDAFLTKPIDLVSLQSVLDGCSQRHAVPASGQQPVLDETVYEKMTRMMPASAVREVYQACLDDFRTRGREMQAAGVANDLPLVRQTAHTFKGSAGMIGAKKLASAAAELELGTYPPEDVPVLVDNLLSCCDELHRILLAKL
jgi:CheY-like chemotaxis protein/HPt (histidine-containing phosphotransfer) domain-containing protein